MSNPIDVPIVYPIAETFLSVQGEGLFAGTLMYFIRFAGCNVGKAVPKETPISELPILGIGGITPNHTLCTSFAGEEFWCDTDYRMTEKLTTYTLLQRVQDSGAKHVCLTGGEPFLYDLYPLAKELTNYNIHIETSGTKPIPEWVRTSIVLPWITCSPKTGYIQANGPYINEFKFVCGPNFDWDQLAQTNLGKPNPLIYISPINNVHTLDPESAKRALDQVMRHPQLRLTMQMHKLLGVR